jgi:putative FmdB family regulatory protein
MPIYEYVCQKCGKTTEVIQGYSDPPLKICPHCGGKRLKKAISAPAIQFKGSGWYVNDYGKGGAGPRSAEKESDSSSKTESADKPETKPAAADAKPAAEKKPEKKKGKKTGD